MKSYKLQYGDRQTLNYNGRVVDKLSSMYPEKDDIFYAKMFQQEVMRNQTIHRI